MRRNIAKKSRCAICDKATFRDERSAKRAIADVVRLNPGKDYVPERWYWCEHAKGYHLTSKKERGFDDDS